MAGDWNVLQDLDKDTSNYSAKNKKRAHDNILDMIESLDLVDIWRAINTDTKRFTWRGPGLKQSPLDYFLILSDLEPFVKNVDMDISYMSDHYPVFLTLQFYNQIKELKLAKLLGNYEKDPSELLKSEIKILENELIQHREKIVTGIMARAKAILAAEGEK
ncbi:Hypothetical predicted protein [Mytilus galloprovincialis]|uniref:Endonuclease/exonuclease/phosphatase domain-containing protein n=1 Tax=Mytilus galloprovincialis TaxID=29158 RepID=A0A8B6CDP9_MYTGA|nr:Hypothetical predicted protein [Mytilus galloprovincialis]